MEKPILPDTTDTYLQLYTRYGLHLQSEDADRLAQLECIAIGTKLSHGECVQLSVLRRKLDIAKGKPAPAPGDPFEWINRVTDAELYGMMHHEADKERAKMGLPPWDEVVAANKKREVDNE